MRHQPLWPRSHWTYLFCCFALLGLAACDESEQPQDPIPCVTQLVQVVTPDGGCAWVATCNPEDFNLCDVNFSCDDVPADLCDQDARCKLTEVRFCEQCDPSLGQSCRCIDVPICEDKNPPVTPCSALDEYTCQITNGCQPEYGWLYGGDTPSTRPVEGAELMPAPDWGFLRCVVSPQNNVCQGLPFDTCQAHPGCEPVWGSAPCDCGDNGFCACPDIAVYEGCIAKSNNGCAAFYDPYTCHNAPGCTWLYTYDDVPMPDEVCECDAAGNCACSGFAPAPTGVCVRDNGPVNCWEQGNEWACWNAGCEWVYGDDGFRPPPPPEECLCDSEGCRCTGAPEPYPGYGYCQPPTTFNCFDYYDPTSCSRDQRCEWFEESFMPAPCYCPDGGMCDCERLPYPMGYCGWRQSNPCDYYGDPTSCQMDRNCEWIGWGYDEPMPCYCEPNGECRCEAAPPVWGYCTQRSTTCWDYYDAFACERDSQCQWNYEYDMDPAPCFCENPNEPCDCGGLWWPGDRGYCSPQQGLSCYDLSDQWSCGATPGCRWYTDDVIAPAPPMCPEYGRYDDTGRCFGPSGYDLPSQCCEQNDPYEPPMPGYCAPDEVLPSPCAEHIEPYSCMNAGSCTWLWADCACPGDVPCDCMPFGTCVDLRPAP